MTDEQSIQRLFVHRAEFDLAMTYKQIRESPAEQFYATALSVRDRLIERWKDTEIYFDKNGVKRVYYLSLEFLMGRSLTNALSNLQLDESFARALRDLGIKLEELTEAVLALFHHGSVSVIFSLIFVIALTPFAVASSL